MNVAKLYKLKRGNQNQTVSVIIKGTSAAVMVYGSQSIPASISNMELCHDETLYASLDSGWWSFSMLPEYIYFDGEADFISIVGPGYDDTGISFENPLDLCGRLNFTVECNSQYLVLI